MSRAAMLAGASTLLAVSSCGTYGGPVCPSDEVVFYSPCGVESISTTCSSQPPSSCVTKAPPQGSCDIGPIAANCTISVTLGDGTTHTIPVTVRSTTPREFCKTTVEVTSPLGLTDFTSPTCPPLVVCGQDLCVSTQACCQDCNGNQTCCPAPACFDAGSDASTDAADATSD